MDHLKEFENVKTKLGRWKQRRFMKQVRSEIEYYKKEIKEKQERISHCQELLDTYSRIIVLLEKQEQLI